MSLHANYRTDRFRAGVAVKGSRRRRELLPPPRQWWAFWITRFHIIPPRSGLLLKMTFVAGLN